MKKNILSKAVVRSQKIREIYHQLELKHHGSEWTVEEDALAFLTDAGLVGRLTMAQQGRWPLENETAHELEHKLGECIWWLIVLAERMEIDAEIALEVFLTKTEQQLKGSLQSTPLRTKAKGRAKKSLISVAASTMKKEPNKAL
jgi:hypothetical protein